MLAMEMPFFGHLRGVGGRCWAIGPITPQTTTRRPRSPDLAGCGLVGWWRGSAMQAMREKKLRAMRAMGGRVGAPPPKTAPLSPYTRPDTHPPFWRVLEGAGWWPEAQTGSQCPGLGRVFFRLQAQFFFFFCETRPPVPIRSADIFPIFFLTALTGFNAANGH